jgi:hypothetical protein
MARDDAPDDVRLTDAQLRDVIERATRIHAQPDGVTLTELRHIARELDIDPAALALALKDVLDGLPGQRPASSPRSWLSKLGAFADGLLPRRARLAVFAFLAASLGWLTAVAGAALRESARDTSFVDVTVVIALLGLTLVNSLSRSVRGRWAWYFAETMAIWSAFALGWSLTRGKVTDDLLSLVLYSVSAFGIWGWLLMRGAKPAPLDANSTTPRGSGSVWPSDRGGRARAPAGDEQSRDSGLMRNSRLALGRTRQVQLLAQPNGGWS